MDGRKNNHGKKGNKGGPGRTSLIDEELRTAVVTRCWEILAEYLADESIPEREKKTVALEIAKKTIPQQLDANLNGNLTIQWQTEQSQSRTRRGRGQSSSTSAKNAG